MADVMTWQAERDALATLGLLARAYELFDVPVEYPGESAPSHILGLNIHALIVDNADGEVLALERNTIHMDGSPLQHGEQRALRTAIARVGTKRPKQPTQAIEGYYRSSMFLAKGTTLDDFYNLGVTLYTSLEPCPYCASALLVARMKRVAYLIPDNKYGGAWTTLKAAYYAGDDTTYLQLALTGSASAFADKVEQLRAQLIAKADQLRTGGTRDTHILDFCRDELKIAFDLIRQTKPSDLTSTASGDLRNSNTLADLQRLLGMPVQ
ncbi:MAG TPA: nucleoside deaminase [Longimicrobium sp.]|uniref:nucleoside deaminase n=1 Tax=Longimicrobium sp. TaxID=2029185 RepID=UPI002ED965D9